MIDRLEVTSKTWELGYLAWQPQTNCKLLISLKPLCSFMPSKGHYHRAQTTTPLEVIGQAFNQSEQGNGGRTNKKLPGSNRSETALIPIDTQTRCPEAK